MPKIKNEKIRAQVALEYFILLAMIGVMTLVSFSSLLPEVRGSIQGDNGFVQTAIERITPLPVMTPVNPPTLENQLLQNYPDPFDSATSIPFILVNTYNVVIKIYDSAKTLVRSYNLGTKPAGSYLARDEAACWDGENSAGQEVHAGVYFYSIQAGSFGATREMTKK